MVESGFDPIYASVTYTTRSNGTLTFQTSIVPLYDEMQSSFRKGCASFFALILRDITEEVRQRKLAEDETKKHMQIIHSILPNEIAVQILDHNKSISFDVPVASISFCDIVSFTPWCSATPEDDVVKTLNRMFTLFDEQRAKYPTVTKIKCIGDCYMSASGIFGANGDSWGEMVNFCLDLLDCIVEVNKEMKMSLQIRVGAAMGGPISAGVLGLEKPSFDLWGALINEAQSMESGGKAMKVHINNLLYQNVKNMNLNFEHLQDDTYLVLRPETK